MIIFLGLEKFWKNYCGSNIFEDTDVLHCLKKL
jgi:hypothetical protein